MMEQTAILSMKIPEFEKAFEHHLDDYGFKKGAQWMKFVKKRRIELVKTPAHELIQVVIGGAT